MTAISIISIVKSALKTQGQNWTIEQDNYDGLDVLNIKTETGQEFTLEVTKTV